MTNDKGGKVPFMFSAYVIDYLCVHEKLTNKASKDISPEKYTRGEENLGFIERNKEH